MSCYTNWSPFKRPSLVSFGRPLTPGRSDGYDRLFVPMAAHTTGDIDVHDIALDHQGQLVFINTLFSCLARMSSRWSFEPIWHPAFIGRVAAEDRCHLNGLAMETSQPAYVTACSQTDTAKGWGDVRRDGGCLVDVRRNEVVVERLSLPTLSPPARRSTLAAGLRPWLFRTRGRESWRLEPLVFCPGYARAGVHRSVCHRGSVETATRTDLQWPGTRRGIRSAEQSAPQCGLLVIDCERCQVVEWLQIEGQVEELYDVIVLPGVECPKLLGLKTDEIRRQLWFVEGERIVSWSASQPPGTS